MTTAIVLAAGGSRRFGSAKQLATLGGEPLVRRALLAALEASLSPVLCVVGACADDVVAAIDDLEVERCINSAWKSGLSTSIACGVAEAVRRGETESVVILLADQPLIDAGHIRELCAQRLEAGFPMAATDDGSTLGVPAVFDASCFAALQALTGDRGAGALLRQSTRCVRVPLSQRLTSDIDTQDDLAALSNPRHHRALS